MVVALEKNILVCKLQYYLIGKLVWTSLLIAELLSKIAAAKNGSLKWFNGLHSLAHLANPKWLVDSNFQTSFLFEREC